MCRLGRHTANGPSDVTEGPFACVAARLLRGSPCGLRRGLRGRRLASSPSRVAFVAVALVAVAFFAVAFLPLAPWSRAFGRRLLRWRPPRRSAWPPGGPLGGAGAAGEDRREELAGVAVLHRGDLLGRALGDDQAAAVAALGAHVDDPVGVLDDVEVVLDDDDGVALVDQPLQHLEQLADVLEVQTGRRLVEDVDGAAGGPLLQLGGQLDALRLTTGERGRGLAEPDVAEARPR